MIECNACGTLFCADEIFDGYSGCSQDNATYEAGNYRCAASDEECAQAREEHWDNGYADDVWICPDCMKDFYSSTCDTLDDYIQMQQTQGKVTVDTKLL